MGKRKQFSPAEKTIDETQGLHGVSEDSRRKIFNSACVSLDRPEEQVNAAKWKRLVSASCPQIYEPVTLNALEGSTVTFFVASIAKLLQHIIISSKGYASEVQKVLKRYLGKCLQIILYNDEAQGGNLLSPDSSKKSSLWYFCLKEVGWRWSDVVWHPIALIQHNEIERVIGGFSAIVKAILRKIFQEDLHLGFPVELPEGPTILRCEIKWMVSDLDSIRGALSLKGSSAIRCCLFCQNCIKKHAGLVEDNPLFQDITSTNLAGFLDQSDGDIFELWDYLVNQKRILSKSAMQKKEQASGFNVCSAALLSDHMMREILPPWSFLLDTMHLYWSNGIVSWEVKAAYDT